MKSFGMAGVHRFAIGLGLVSTVLSTHAGDVTKNLADGNTDFAFKLYHQLGAGDGNLFFSPYSISTCLGMVYAGAQGDTASQMSNTLGYGYSPEAVSKPFMVLQGKLDQEGKRAGVELNIANAVWAQKEHPFLANYLDAVRTDFFASLKQADFRSKAEPTRIEINDWVSGKTKGRIKDLMPQGSIDETTRMVLVNAIYFKGRWSEPFQKRNTYPADFHLGDGGTVQVPTMNTEASVKYNETADFKVLEMSYSKSEHEGSPLSMVIMLPKELHGIKTLEQTLTNGVALDAAIEKMSRHKVRVYVPKFKLTGELDLGDTLAAMGMPLAFTNTADFSGMDGDKDLYISRVVHKAFVEVNEEGTEAAAATGTAMVQAAARPMQEEVPEFRADHPFLYFIRDSQTGSILFMGRMMNPAK